MNKATRIVVGASGGIGSAVCRLLATKGHKLHLLARREEPLTALAQELGATFNCIDAAIFEELEREVGNIQGESAIDSIVNCAGSVILKPAHLTSQKEFEDTILRNLTTAFSTVRVAGKFLKKSSVVLCSTAAVRIGLQNHEAIAAAKGGVEALVRSAASTYAAKGIRVNAVAPGLVHTPMTDHIVSNERSLKYSTAMHALGRIGKPQDVASAISWLIDSDQSWVTGQVIAVDGGLSSVMATPGSRS
jgi:NAD(P)-dependent dehydrogenase (short-subunit alcohol dehydrogenase family)